MRTADAGFTLLELLIAVAISAMVALAAIATLNAFTEADVAATGAIEETAGVNRTLQSLRADVGNAQTLRVAADRLVLTMPDGTGIAWLLAAGDTELHRLTAADAAAAEALADATVAAATSPATFNPRGHLADKDYRATAVLQGMARIAITAVAPGGSTLGARITVVGPSRRSSQVSALSLALTEAFTKSGAAAGNAAAVSSPSAAGGGAAKK